MIRINLLPVKEERRKIALRNHLIIFALSLVLLFVIMFSMQKNINSRKERLNHEIAQVESEIKRLREITKKIKPTQNKKAELQEKLKVIASLEGNRLFPVKVLDKLSNAAPNQLWFTKLVFANGSIKITGKALDHRLVAEFVKNLEKIKYFKDIEIGGTTLVTKGPWNLVNFNISMKVQNISNSTG